MCVLSSPLARLLLTSPTIPAQDMAFLVAGKPTFTIPLTSVLNTSITKAEVALEFSSAFPPAPASTTEDAVARKKRLRAMPDEVSELRLYIPGSARGMKKKGEKARIKAEGGEVKDDDEEESDEESGEEGEGETAAQVFHDAIKEKADIGQVTGESFCTIPDVLCLTPRGRFGEFARGLLPSGGGNKS
jgi:structure-specific recognition protein 1